MCITTSAYMDCAPRLGAPANPIAHFNAAEHCCINIKQESMRERVYIFATVVVTAGIVRAIQISRRMRTPPGYLEAVS
ncbi:unnamed protein product, partial [Brenthis ino]